MRPASPRDDVAAYARHVNPGLVRLLGVLGYGRRFVRAEGARLFDDEGRAYLDALAGFGAVNVGHHHPRVAAAALAAARGGPWGGGRAASTERLERALLDLAGPTFGDALFATGGAEAVELALKVARVVTGRARVVSCRHGYHGLNTASLSLTGVARMRSRFEPLLDGCVEVPFGDADALAAALRAAPTAAFVVEPAQCEGGIVFAPRGYLARAAALCREAGALFVVDEVQTGLGRLGTTLAIEGEGLEGDLAPDAVVLAKSLGGSLCALGATLFTRGVVARARRRCPPGLLAGSEQAASHLACAVALETLAILRDEHLVERARVDGEALRDGLARRLAGHPLVREVRGRALLVGIELAGDDRTLLGRLAPRLDEALARAALGHWFAVRLLERGVVCQPTLHRPDVLRLEPPLTLGPEGARALADAVAEVLDEGRDVARVSASIARRLAARALTGWSF